MVLSDILELEVKRILDVAVVVILQSDGKDPVVCYGFALKVELQERVGLLVILDLESCGKLIELGMGSCERLITEHPQDGVLELGACPPHYMRGIVIREADAEITLCDNGTQRFCSYRT